MNTKAFGLIDAQRGFMPAEEGERINIGGIGELPITDGQKIVPKVNALLAAFAMNAHETFTTQDWHPHQTAHFSEEPNYNTTWPRHCVANTPGAKLHPAIIIPTTTEAFKKGNESLENGAEDTSYTGYNGVDESGESLADWLREKHVTELYLGGLALDYCVKATALDVRQKMGIEVTVVEDATKAVAEETARTSIDELAAAGVQFITTKELLERIADTAA